MIPDESLLSYLMSTPDYYGKTRSPLKFYILDETGKPARQVDNGESKLLFDQERVMAFDYQSICDNFDINLRVISERVSTQNPDGIPTPNEENNGSTE